MREDASNKAGYTANTSCRRVGRGGNARFYNFQLVLMDRQTNGRTNGPTDGRTDGWTKALRVACPQLKRKLSDTKKINEIGLDYVCASTKQ